MKFLETTFDEYCARVATDNLHPELSAARAAIPADIRYFPNMIFCGPAGAGKYSQVLWFLRRVSPLKVDTKQTAQYNKNTYTYRMSDVHYEIDMSLLGCNSKLLWHEIFVQIYEMVQVLPHKVGIIVCKNFHCIHSELLEIFYSYIQEYNQYYEAGCAGNVLLKFVIVTESIGFIPANIVQSSQVIRVARPAAAAGHENMKEILCGIPTSGGASAASRAKVCDALIRQIRAPPDRLNLAEFRENIYDIFTYNLDVAECIWTVVAAVLRTGGAPAAPIVTKLYPFLKYFNNNYRPIYHIEDFFINIIIHLHGLDTRAKNIGN